MAAAACASPSQPGQGTAVDGVATYPREDSWHATVIYSGEVEERDGCLYVETGQEQLLPVFPDGQVEWDGSVLTYGGSEYAVGDDILLGGSESPLPEGAYVPATCGTDATLIITSVVMS